MASHVVIDGSIGAGKTTLLYNLKKQLDPNLYSFHEENVNSWMEEGWLKKYYSNIPRYASSFQTRVLLSHIEQRNSLPDKHVVNIFERSAITTVYVFSQMLVDDGHLDTMEMDLHKKMLEMFDYQKPDLLIYLDTSPELSFERLKKRSRNGEIDITLDYLQKLSKIYNQEKDKLAKRVVILDGNKSEEEVLSQALELL